MCTPRARQLPARLTDEELQDLFIGSLQVFHAPDDIAEMLPVPLRIAKDDHADQLLRPESSEGIGIVAGGVFQDPAEEVPARRARQVGALSQIPRHAVDFDEMRHCFGRHVAERREREVVRTRA